MSTVTAENWRSVVGAFKRQTIYEGRVFPQEWNLLLERVGAVAGGVAIDEWLRSGKAHEAEWACTALSGWAAASPNAAFEWERVRNNNPGENFNADLADKIEQSILVGVGRGDPQLALTMIENKHMDPVISAMVDASIERGGFHQADELLRSLEKSDLRTFVKTKIFEAVGKRKHMAGMMSGEPLETLTWLEPYLGRPEVGDQFLHDMVWWAAERNASAAFEWMEKRSARLEKPDDTTPFRPIARFWLKQAPDQFRAWTDANPNHPQHDVLVFDAVALMLNQGQVDAVREWAASMKNPKTRAGMEEAIQRKQSERNVPR